MLIRDIVALFALFVFAFGTWAQNSPSHQHVVAATTVINGSKNPEQIPDSVAYRMWLLTASTLPNAATKDTDTQSAHLAKLSLTSEIDHLALQATLNDFRSQYIALIEQYNASAKAAVANGGRPDLASFLQQRDDLVQATRTAIALRLSPEGAARVDKAVQEHKRSIHLAVAK